MINWTRFVSLARFTELPGMVRAQLGATLLNSASVIVKLFMPLLFRGSYSLDFHSIGMLMATYGAGCVAGAYVGGVLTGRVDSRKLTAACLCVGGALATSLSRLPDSAWLFVAVPLIGVADGAFRPANLRLVMEASGAVDATWLQGLHRICFNFGVALAGVAAACLSDAGYPTLFTVAGLANAAGGCLLLLHLRQSSGVNGAQPKDERISIASPGSASLSPWTDRAFLLFVLGQLLALGIFDQMYGAFGLYLAEDYGLDARWVGYLFSFNALLIVCVQAPAMILIGRIGPVAASRWGTLLLAMAFPLLNLGVGPIYAFATMGCVTAAEILLTPAWTLAVMDCSANRDRGRYLGIYSAAWLGHSLYGPAAGTWIYGSFGGRTLWWTCAAVGLVVCVIHHRSLRKFSYSALRP